MHSRMGDGTMRHGPRTYADRGGIERVTDCTQHQVLSFIFGFAVLAFFMLFQAPATNLQYQFQNFSRGVLDTRDASVYLLLTAFFLYANTSYIKSKGWRS